MEKFKKIILILVIIILFLVNLFLFNGKMINIHTDFGREILFSKLVSQGSILYRDIFNTFVCPFSYLFNAMILKVLPMHTNTFFFLGAVNCLLILITFYFIARRFLNDSLTFVITLFVMYYCCFYVGLMNYITPYSYAVVYGLSASLVSIYLYLKYLDNAKTFYLYLTFFFAGIALSCKYEFILYSISLIFFILLKKIDAKTFLKSLGMLSIMPVICLVVLGFMGLKYNDIGIYLGLLKNFLNQPFLKQVYYLTCYPSGASLISALKTFLFSGGIIFLLYKFFENKNRIFKLAGSLLWIVLAFLALFNLSFIEYSAYCFWGSITYIVLGLFLFNFNKLNSNYHLCFLTVVSMVIAMKSFWFMSTNFYGRYFLPLLLLVLVVLIKEIYVKDELRINIYKKTVSSLLIFLSFVAFRLNFANSLFKVEKLITPYTSLSLTKQENSLHEPLILYLIQNTTEKDTVVVLGEAPILNFIINRNTIPLYSHYDNAIAGAYGVNKIINAYEFYKPDYFIVFDVIEEKDSYCLTYGKEVCLWLLDNYKVSKVFESSDRKNKVYVYSKY